MLAAQDFESLLSDFDPLDGFHPGRTCLTSSASSQLLKLKAYTSMGILIFWMKIVMTTCDVGKLPHTVGRIVVDIFLSLRGRHERYLLRAT